MFFGNKCAAKDVKILCLSSFENSFVYNSKLMNFKNILINGIDILANVLYDKNNTKGGGTWELI